MAKKTKLTAEHDIPLERLKAAFIEYNRMSEEMKALNEKLAKLNLRAVAFWQDVIIRHRSRLEEQFGFDVSKAIFEKAEKQSKEKS